MSRISVAEELTEPAERTDEVDLNRMWNQRCAQFLAEGHITVHVRVHPAHRESLLEKAEAVRAEEPEPEGWLRLEATFQDLWHAEWALWQLGTNAEALSPQRLRTALHRRAASLANRYQHTPS